MQQLGACAGCVRDQASLCKFLNMTGMRQGCNWAADAGFQGSAAQHSRVPQLGIFWRAPAAPFGLHQLCMHAAWHRKAWGRCICTCMAQHRNGLDRPNEVRCCDHPSATHLASALALAALAALAGSLNSTKAVPLGLFVALFMTSLKEHETHISVRCLPF